MKYIIIGTAGHIDHGKTALTKAITGIDTDRLKEEKARGITIELGFAYLDLPSKVRASIIDVPGHERFVHHMVAGVGGIDLVLLVVAADEGIMPQTKEHFDICKLLGIKQGIIVITKKDLVDETLLDLVKEEIFELVKGTFLEVSPVIPVSALTGEGIPLLIERIDKLLQQIIPRNSKGTFRLPIDRVFTVKGFGTVVTGTVFSGSLNIGDSVVILPKDITAKVRGIEVHNQKVETVSAGQRAAINLQGIEKEKLDRGDTLVELDKLKPTFMLDAKFYLLKDYPRSLTNRSRIRLLLGTQEVMGRAVILERDELKAGDESYVQFRLEEPVVALTGDRFIIRSYSPLRTIGGGTVIDIYPQRHKRFKKEILDQLGVLAKGNLEARILLVSKFHENLITSSCEISARLGTDDEVLVENIKPLIHKGKLLFLDDKKKEFINRDTYNQIKKEFLLALTEFHKKNPLTKGIMKEELRSKLRNSLDIKLFTKLLSDIEKEEIIALDNESVRLSTHKIDLKDDQSVLIKKVEDIFLKGGVTPPNIGEVVETYKIKQELLNVLLERGLLVRLKDGIIYHKKVLDNIGVNLKTYLKEHKEISLGDFKDQWNISRKYTIPLLEYFDNIKLTMRVGDKRVLRDRN
ncbi:MAG: selenocysteine-specific translation elongation factor [bacterium]